MNESINRRRTDDQKRTKTRTKTTHLKYIPFTFLPGDQIDLLKNRFVLFRLIFPTGRLLQSRLLLLPFLILFLLIGRVTGVLLLLRRRASYSESTEHSCVFAQAFHRVAKEKSRRGSSVGGAIWKTATPTAKRLIAGEKTGESHERVGRTGRKWILCRHDSMNKIKMAKQRWKVQKSLTATFELKFRPKTKESIEFSVLGAVSTTAVT